MTPAWVLDTFAALMLVVAALSAARVVAARPWRPGSVILDTDIAHLLMAIAMAGMLAVSLRTLPDRAWAAVFCVLTAWFGYRVVRDARASGVRALAGGHCAPHLVHSAAMLYMFLALAAPTAGAAGMSGMDGSATQPLEYPTLAFAFGLVLAAYSVQDLDLLSAGRYRLAPAGPALPGVPALAGTGSVAAPRLLRPGTTVGCRIAMGVTMAFMLFVMI
jgi:hypothetical protein